MVKGFTYTLEAAIILILVVSIAVFLYKPVQRPDISLAETAWACLKGLDNQGALSDYIGRDDKEGLEAALGDCLPKTMGFSIAYCGSSNCPAATPEKPVYTAEYLLAGNPAKLVSVYVWSLL